MGAKTLEPLEVAVGVDVDGTVGVAVDVAVDT